MSTQSCSNSKAAGPMNAVQTGKHNLQASCKNCSQRCAYLTGDSCPPFTHSSFVNHARQQVSASPNYTAGYPCSICFRHFCRFCRFYSEEAYSFRVCDIAPEALRVLDMQDMHCLRKGNQVAYAVMHQHLHHQCFGANEQGHFGENMHHCMQARHTAALSTYAIEITSRLYALLRFHAFSSLTFVPKHAMPVG